MKELKIGTSWVRGIVGEALTPELLISFARAFGTWVDGSPVVIGRDTRRSSGMVRSAVVSGLLASECRVIDLGLTSTPQVAFAVRELGAGGGICVTGSHNEAGWNALKFIGPDGTLLNTLKSEELLDVYHAGAYRAATHYPAPPTPAPDFLLEAYLDFLLSALEVEAVRERHFRVVVDYCNGPLFETTSRFLDRLECTAVPLHEVPDGSFRRRPEPTVVSMGELARSVRESKADLGAALNIDGDRIGFVTEQGEGLPEELTLPLVAMSRLTRRPGLSVTNFSTSLRIDKVARDFGQSVLRTGVGESHVVDRGLEEGAVLAGEGSGGVAILPASTTFDALLSLGLVLERLALNGLSLSKMARSIPETFMMKGELRCPPAAAYRALEKCRAAFAGESLDLSDGLRVAWEDAWVHIRVSNTEPVLRVIAEAASAQRVRELYAFSLATARDVLSEGAVAAEDAR